jgi:hypothetical protein
MAAQTRIEILLKLLGWKQATIHQINSECSKILGRQVDIWAMTNPEFVLMLNELANVYRDFIRRKNA